MKGITLIQIEHMDEVLKHALVLTDPDTFFKTVQGAIATWRSCASRNRRCR